MFYNDHSPPHFHATYGEFVITVEIESGIVSGEFPSRALNHVMEWQSLHKTELLENWTLLKNHQPLNKIQPLE
jgi:hypothetical protein